MLPEWINYAHAEQQAAVLVRNLENVDLGWGELIATAQTILSYYQEFPLEKAHLLYDEKHALPLIAAARILDSASQHVVEIPAEHKIGLALSASVAFSMYGNFPSALAAIKLHFNSIRINEISLILIGTVVPSYITQLISQTQSKLDRSFLELLQQFLETGDAINVGAIKDIYQASFANITTDLEGSLLRSARLTLRHLINLSTARVLKKLELGFDPEYVFKVVTMGAPVLLPPQYKAIVDRNLLSSSENVLISLPTSTGKTLLGEFTIMTSLRDGPGIVCYVAPYVALGNQVVGKLERHCIEGIRIHKLMAGLHKREEFSPDEYKEIIVATPERLDMLLAESPWVFDYLRAVIFDEAHIIESGVRGIRLEGLLSRLRMQQQHGRKFRLVILSAVLQRYEAIKKWLNISEANVITDTWKPTARRTAFWEDSGHLIYYLGNDPVRLDTQTNESVLGKRVFPWPAGTGYLHPTNERKEVPDLTVYVHANAAYLANFLYQREKGIIFCVCATKINTRKMANALKAYFKPMEPLPPTIQTAISRIQNRHKFLTPLADLLRCGIAYHNSTVPHDVRNLIVEAAQKHEMKVIVSTSTLSEGVDLPFRHTILVDWLSYNPPIMAPMSSLIFNNVSGRCGRANEYTEGDTIVYDNQLGDLKYTEPSRRRRYQYENFLIQNHRELVSSLGKLSGPAETVVKFRAALSRQFMSSIPENPSDQTLVSSFYNSLLVSQNQSVGRPVRHILAETEAFLLDETEEPFAKAASPITLTELGQAANKTALSPQSCRRLVRFLKQVNLGVDIYTLTTAMLRAFGAIPEQPNEKLRQVLMRENYNFCVKPKSFETVMHLWLNGVPRERIFAALPDIATISRRPKLQEWLNGVSENTKWDDDYDAFVDFTNNVLEGFLPWLLWSAGCLCEFGNDVSKATPWNDWSQMMEKGVNSTWAVKAIENNIPGRRATLIEIGKRWPQEYQSEIDSLGINFIHNEQTRRDIERIFDEVYFLSKDSLYITPRDVYSVQDWLWKRATQFLPPLGIG